MKLIHRLGFYLGGFAIGLIFLAFFLSGKNVSCDYSPQARVKKNINSKKLSFANELQNTIIDTSEITSILRDGKILFSKSDTRKEPCGIYVIEKEMSDNKKTIVTLENCDQTVTVRKIVRE